MKYGSTCIFVNDVRQVIDFYVAAFGFEQKFYDPEFDFGIVVVGDAEISIASHHAGEQMMPNKYNRSEAGNPQGIEIAFYSDTVDRDFERAITAGARCLNKPSDTSWGQRVAYVESIEGTIIGICSPLDHVNS